MDPYMSPYPMLSSFFSIKRDWRGTWVKFLWLRIPTGTYHSSTLASYLFDHRWRLLRLVKFSQKCVSCWTVCSESCCAVTRIQITLYVRIEQKCIDGIECCVSFLNSLSLLSNVRTFVASAQPLRNPVYIHVHMPKFLSWEDRK